MNTKTYVLKNGKTITGMSNEIEQMLSLEENMDTQMLTMDDQSVIIQARIRGGEYKKLIGMDRAITVRLIPIGEHNATIEIAHSKWLNKGTAGFVGAHIIAWPLVVMAAYSTYKQCRLPSKIISTVEAYMNNNADASVVCSAYTS